MSVLTNNPRRVIAWALYDWANSAFATTVLAGFFPIFWKNYWTAGLADDVSNMWLGAASAMGSILVAICAPVAGAFADRAGGKKRLLACFALLGVFMTAGLATVPEGAWLIAGLLYVLASIGFAAGNIFYDALLVGVAPREKRDFVSGLGFSLGYLGGGVLFVLNVWMVESPETFGLAGKTEAVQWSFVTVAVWWLLFALPLMLWVPEPAAKEPLSWGLAMRGLRQVVQTCRDVRAHRPVLFFLIAYWLYIDGVDTVIRMAVAYGKSLNLADGALIKALLLVQFVGFPAALAYGWLGQKIGPRRGIYLGISIYTLVTIMAVFMRTEAHFYGLAVVIGLVQGGVQALSRSYFSNLIPEDQAGEFFGFYNMLGKFAAVIGPVLMGAAGLINVRLSILALLPLFIGGAWFLHRAEEERDG